MKNVVSFLSILLALAVGCGDDDGMTPNDAGGGMDSAMTDAGTEDTGATDSGVEDGGMMMQPEYAFESQFVAGESSVAYSGQTLRHVLIEEIKGFLGGGLDAAIAAGAPGFDSAEGIRANLDVFYRLTDENIDDMIRLSTDPAALQTTYADISGPKSLEGKLAGNDASRMHRDWSTEFAGWSASFEGWEAEGDAGRSVPQSPSEFVDALLDTIAARGEARANGEGDEFPSHVTPEGLDMRQLVQKFLLGAVAFSQGADDYLDEGLDAPNTQDDDNPYSELEHQWDEGFGYYGAARNFFDYDIDSIAGGVALDADEDGAIDFRSERHFGASVNAAKRDKGSTSGTTIARDAFIAFYEGRAIIASGDTSDAAMARLRTVRDRAVLAWEQAIAATAIHYVNDTIADLDAIGSDDYSFLDHAKHWGELKGFALSFQFNPRSPVTQEQFAMLHTLIGDAPSLEADAVAARKAELEQARDIMRDAYGFSAEDAANW